MQVKLPQLSSTLSVIIEKKKPIKSLMKFIHFASVTLFADGFYMSFSCAGIAAGQDETVGEEKQLYFKT